MASVLAQGKEISVASEARRLGVHPMTIRRDLAALANAGVLVRCYGGGIPAQRITFEFEFDERRRRRLAEKKRLGSAAAERVQPGQTVMLDTGTTTLQVAKAIAASGRSCTCITSSLVIASQLWAREEIELMLLGGRVRRGSPDLVGPAVKTLLAKLTADIAFLGSDGVDPTRGCFAGDIETAYVAEQMAASARQVIVVADSSKLGLAGNVRSVSYTHLTLPTN